MGGVGRVLCVALPFILTAVSLVTLLIVGLAGITGSNLSLFEVAPRDLSINLSDLQKLDLSGTKARRDIRGLGSSVTGAIDAVSHTNITAAQLNLADKYNFYLWNFVEVRGDVTTKTSPKFNYASNFTDTSSVGDLAAGTGITVTVPQAVQDGLKLFSTLIKWTQIVFVVAIVATALALLVGLFGFCSRIGSCGTWIISSISTAAIIGFATLATVTATSVVGVLTGVAKPFGVTSSVSTAWLSIIWFGVAAAVASVFFWLLTVCCCASSGGKGNRHSNNAEKLTGSKGYQPVRDPFGNEAYAGQQSGIYNQQQYAIPLSNVKTNRAEAYEPYSHHAV